MLISIKREKNKQVRDLLCCLTRVEKIRHMLTIQTHRKVFVNELISWRVKDEKSIHE